MQKTMPAETNSHEATALSPTAKPKVVLVVGVARRVCPADDGEAMVSADVVLNLLANSTGWIVLLCILRLRVALIDVVDDK
jgi:hypothetical protein